MELTIDDCLAIAGRECATEHELRAAVCVAVGQALHYRYEARGYSDAAETAKRDADRARAEARAYSEALIAKDSAPDTSDGIDYPARAEVWRLRESVDALRARAERAEAARDRAVQEREAFSLRLSAAERERDEARAERDASDERWATVCRECDVALAERDAVQALHAELVATRADFVHQRDITEDALRERDDARAALDLARESAREAREEIAQSLALVDEARAALDAALARPTYEVRMVAPTIAEREAHQAAGGAWLVCRIDSDGKLHADVLIGWHGWRWEGYFFVALDAKRRPCAWPVVT